MNYPRNANHQKEMFAMIKSSIESGINRKLFFKQQGNNALEIT
jgi:hypothetical protein